MTTSVGTRTTVGEGIARAIAASGVTHAYTVPGESFLGLLDALPNAGIRVVAARHEGGAGFMAAADAHLTGSPSALLVTRAVGATNASIAIHTAFSDSVPMIVLVGQVPRAHRGREAFQEVDLASTIGGLAKWAREPGSAQEAIEMAGTAARVAREGRPGPVLLALPEDLLDQEVGGGPPLVELAVPAPVAEGAVARALAALRSAEAPVILAGAGVLRAGATGQLRKLAEQLEIPVIAGWRRPEVIDNEHRLYLGMTGYWAPSTVPDRLKRADVILVLGSRLGEPTTFGFSIPREGTTWVDVNLEPRAAGSRMPDVSVAGDAADFLDVALRSIAAEDTGRRDARRASNDADRAAWERATVVDGVDWTGPGVHPGRVVTTLQRVLRDDAVLTTDAGNFAGWPARGYRFRGGGTLLGPTSGAMGYALPAAIAAAIRSPERQIVAVAGDGGLGMTMMELETAVREQARLVVICFDNRRYGTIRMWQERRKRGVGIATELGVIDFSAVARAVGASGYSVEADAQFEPALRAALSESGPSLIHLAVDRRWVSVDHLAAEEPSDVV